MTTPGLYLRLVPAWAQAARVHSVVWSDGTWALQYHSFKACNTARAPCSRLHMHTGFVYLDNAAISQFLQQAQQVGLVVAQARVLVALTDAVNTDGAPGERGKDQPLPQLLAATETQHVTYSMLLWQVN